MLFSFTTIFIPFRNSGTHPYHSVPAPDEEISLAAPECIEPRVLTSKRRSFLEPSLWLTTLAVLSVTITVRNLLVVQWYSQEARLGYLDASIASPYNGLEKLVRDESSPSWPLSSMYYPDFIGAKEGSFIHHALSNGSTIRLDSERTTIIQHRVRDFGLEHCAVKVELPNPGGNGPDQTTRDYGHTRDGLHLTLWRLEDTGSMAVLTPSTLPVSLPSRRAFLGDVVLDEMRSVHLPSFRCSAGSIQTLEISVACISDPCIVEFRLIQSPQRQGFWVVQSEETSASMSVAK